MNEFEKAANGEEELIIREGAEAPELGSVQEETMTQKESGGSARVEIEDEKYDKTGETRYPDGRRHEGHTRGYRNRGEGRDGQGFGNRHEGRDFQDGDRSRDDARPRDGHGCGFHGEPRGDRRRDDARSHDGHGHGFCGKGPGDPSRANRCGCASRGMCGCGRR